MIVETLLLALLSFGSPRLSQHGKPAAPSNPVCHMALYRAMVDSIATSGAIKKHFLFIAHRKKETSICFSEGVPKFLVSNKVHMIKPGIDCSADQSFANDSLMTIEALTALSRSTNGHQFMVFFSTIEQGVARCLVVNSSDGHPANNFWSAIRFGRVMEVVFCIEGNEIRSYRVESRTMN